MKPKTDRQFWESAKLNNYTFKQYYNRLTELSISMFDWKNLPDSIDKRFLELVLFGDGMCVFFYDDVLGYLALRCAIGGQMNVYRIPTKRRAYAVNGYNKNLDESNSVIIFNNLLHINSMLDVEMFAKRLYNLDRAIDVNANAQKTPILIQCDEQQRLTLLNMYMKYDGNEPVIFGDKNLNPNSLKVLQTGAPYVADKLYTLKTQIWNEALTYLGISNTNFVKKERLVTDEVMRSQGGTIASRYSRLEARRQACEEINRKFGLDIWCDYREDISIANEIIAEENEQKGEDENE
ncbi:MAG: hypothetical protein J6T10_30660 [Methanobrevibacter sp.]|nr:hypothetical protein [Methanobrevibacter sp.]